MSNYGQLNNDWMANTADHTPLFSIINSLIFNLFSINGFIIFHLILASLCVFSIYKICNLYILKNKNFKNTILWFIICSFIYHEKTFFFGVAGQGILNSSYQPSTFGILILFSLYLFQINKTYFSILSLCLAAIIHPTYLIHSGFLLIGYSFYLICYKNYREFIKINLFYIVLITPIVLYIYYNILVFDNNINYQGQSILYDFRIPHHANINSWISYKDFQSLLLIIASLYLIRNFKTLYVPIITVFILSIGLTVLQFFFENKFLGLLFPWRSSVFLVPLSSLIIMSFILNYFNKFNIDKYFYIPVILLIFLIYQKKLYYFTYNTEISRNEIQVINFLKSNSKSFEKMLIPITFPEVRLNTGIPIFVDWKIHPYKNDELINWKIRIDLVRKFYNADQNQAQLILRKIDKIDNISHILLDNSNPLNFKKCKNLIENNKYSLFDANCIRK